MTFISDIGIERLVRKSMRRHRIHSVSLCCFEQNEISYSSALEAADKEGEIRLDQDTLFQAASISKPVAAAAALRAVDAGMLNLDEDINSWLHSWIVPKDRFTKENKVTLRRLLSHTAGINIHGFSGYDILEEIPTTLQILKGQSPAKNKAIKVTKVPGSAFRYSGGGFVILQNLLSDIFKCSFAKLAADLILIPAKMSHSTFGQPLPADGRSNVAIPYDITGQTFANGSNIYPELAAAGLWTTAEDLMRFALLLQTDYNQETEALLPFARVSEMFAPQSEFGPFGLGFEIDRSENQLCFFHAGKNKGFESYLFVNSTLKKGIVILSNQDNNFGFIRELLKTFQDDWKSIE